MSDKSRQHAKLLAIDRRFLVATSADFSASAERRIAEFRPLVNGQVPTETVEPMPLGVEEHPHWRNTASAVTNQVVVHPVPGTQDPDAALVRTGSRNGRTTATASSRVSAVRPTARRASAR